MVYKNMQQLWRALHRGDAVWKHRNKANHVINAEGMNKILGKRGVLDQQTVDIKRKIKEAICISRQQQP